MIDAPEAVLFDLDGVLVDSFDAWLAVTNTVARGWGYPEITRAAFEAAYGQGVEDDCRTFYPGKTPEEVGAAFERTLPGLVSEMTRNAEAEAALDLLATHGIQRAIVTNTQTGLADRVLKVHGLWARVDAVSALRPGMRGKPAPDLLEMALQELAVAPGAAVMFGDSDYDAEAARQAGVAFVRYEQRRGDSLLHALRQLVGA